MKADYNFWKTPPQCGGDVPKGQRGTGRLAELKNNKPYLTKQQYRTIKGQAVKGNVDAARKGMLRIKQRRQYQ